MSVLLFFSCQSSLSDIMAYPDDLNQNDRERIVILRASALTVPAPSAREMAAQDWLTLRPAGSRRSDALQCANGYLFGSSSFVERIILDELGMMGVNDQTIGQCRLQTTKRLVNIARQMKSRR